MTLSPHTIPLHYTGVRVGRALVDAELTPLTSLPWCLELPRKTRQTLDRPDLICATLREDDGLITQCHPFLQLGTRHRLVIRMSSIAVRPELVPVVLNYLNDPDQEARLCEIRTILNPIQRIVFLNRNRIDCRRVNLRAVTRLMFEALGESQ